MNFFSKLFYKYKKALKIARIYALTAGPGIIVMVADNDAGGITKGGLGVLVGDGKLPHPGAEAIVESYYSLAVVSRAFLSFDYQWVRNPAYNRDRGPVSIFALRVHAYF